ncbi:hypothetical protein FISHEDRAFT_68294 [Fistulina hepatica ATCC 64428]|uniref:DUF7137 domain-containing protein n=1 Tax=Fistulina hepatica ATCC 64428 TaxID=1128425 RepID=A0A0D7A0D8_9AGAR|nr:hypothetical protein FISHEDRAFT_68294 [Fistulina hepatica ATCC 64428]
MGADASSDTSSISIPATAAAGGLTITKPPSTATSYYKIAEGNYVTFAWNMTSVYVTPTHLTVSAVCSANGYTYPVGQNGTIAGTATQIVWDVWSYQENHLATPLAEATYTLTIWGDGGPSATASAGYMDSNDDLEFALYTPQAYTPLASGWECTGCNGQMRSASNPLFLSVFVSCIVIILSGHHLMRRRR